MSKRKIEWTDDEIAAYDPFADDKGDGGWHCVKSRVVTTRVPHTCCVSYDEHSIDVGPRAVIYSAVCRYEGFRRFYICCDCILAWYGETR